VWKGPEKLLPISARTKNAYIASLKSFCKWCVTTGKIPDCPLLHLKRVKDTPPPIRRPATDAEVRRILDAAKAGGDIYGLTGKQRHYLYRVALGTGFRASELASLHPFAFKLKGKLPHIVLAAADAKNDKAAEQPIRPELAAELARWLRGQSGRVWPGLWHKKAAEMLREDLQAAGIKYRDNTGRVLDFHALRVTFITSLSRAGVHPKTAQILARHGDINLTMKYYTHLSLEEVAAVLPRSV
jgi:integrase/recombinase XerD